MSCCDNQTEAICPCDTFIHPRVIFNPPALDAISYRVGDYTTFRHALLLARPGEGELTRASGTRIDQIWRPGASGDLAVQMVEWWAYLADVLTFYNERVAGQAYLRTADLPESVNRLIRLLGYRPRPGIGAVGVLAALANGPKPFTLPQGFQIQSKPGPGKQPQVFELKQDVSIGLPDRLPAVPPPQPSQLGSGTAVIQGTITSLSPGDEVLLVSRGWQGADGNYAVGLVQSVSVQKDPSGPANTLVVLSMVTRGKDLPDSPTPSSYRLLRSNSTAHLYQYLDASSGVSAIGDEPAKGVVPRFAELASIVRGVRGGGPIVSETNGVVPGFAELASIVREIQVGDPIVLETTTADTTNSPLPAMVTAYQERVYYANNPSNPTQPPPPPAGSQNNPPGVPIPHTYLTFDKVGFGFGDATTVSVRYGWKEVGPLISAPATSVGGSQDSGGNAGGSKAASDTLGKPVTLLPIPGVSFPTVLTDTRVLVEDAIGNGDTGILDTASNLRLDDPVPALVPPLGVLFNLLPVTRGKSVANEVLGNGNAALAGQDFVLQNAPVTYLQSPESVSGDDYSSTVRVWVNGLEWKELRSFYGQAADAQVFVTEEDEQGKTHVLFGDGENGARLPTGVNNVTASYRYGSGTQVPDAGSLTVVLQPQPGLKAIRNPVQVGGGSDPDSPAKVRQLAPRSVLTFNRAVSADDYETIAAQAPGVTRARASFAFDATEQRPLVKIWVGDNAGAVDAARSAIAASTDPNRRPGVELATQIVINLSLTLVLDPRRDAQTVLKTVHDALLDADNGLLGVNVVGIGQAFYDSQVYAACLDVPGVQALHAFSFSSDEPPVETGACEGRHDPGDGSYFFLPDDDQHLTLSSTVAA